MKKILDQKGFSLVEIMVATAILGITAVGLMDFSSKRQASTKGVTMQSEFDQFLSLVVISIANPLVCERNLLNKTSGTALQEILDVEGRPVLKVGERYAQGTYVLKGITIGRHFPAVNRTEINLNFERRIKAIGSSSFRKVIFGAFTESVETTITKCLNAEEMNARAALWKMCLDVDPKNEGKVADTGACEEVLENMVTEVKQAFCDSSYPFISWDPSRKKCAPIDARKTCTTAVRGYNGQDQLCCYRPPSPHPGGPIFNQPSPPPETCL